MSTPKQGDAVTGRRIKDDPWLDEFLGSIPGPLEHVIDDVAKEVTWVEQRTRKRRAKDAEGFLLMVKVVVSNLAYQYLKHPEPRPMVVNRDPNYQTTIYDNQALPRRTLGKTLNLLETAGFLSQSRGSRTAGLRATISIASGLVRLIEVHGVDFSCFGRLEGEPLVVVSTKVDRGYHLEAKHLPVSYESTPDTKALQDQVARINDHLTKANIRFLPDGLDPVDPFDRTLRRRFTVLPGQDLRFDQVGRLYGGFWLNLKRARRCNIRIGGQPITDLDFVSLHPRLAYLALGREWPPGDPYDLTGLLTGYDNENPDHRDAVKQGLCSLLNGGRAGAAPGQPSHLDDLPPGTTAGKLRAALKLKHPGLASVIDPTKASTVPLGYRLMMTESRILLNALEHLMSIGVVALPSHDGLFVAQSHARVAQEALQAASFAIVGAILPVKAKAIPDSSQAILGPIHNQHLLEAA